MPQLPIVLTRGCLGIGTLGPPSYFNNVAPLLTQMGAKEIYATDVTRGSPFRGTVAADITADR